MPSTLPSWRESQRGRVNGQESGQESSAESTTIDQEAIWFADEQIKAFVLEKVPDEQIKVLLEKVPDKQIRVIVFGKDTLAAL